MNVIKTNPTNRSTHDLTDCSKLRLGSQENNTHSRLDQNLSYSFKIARGCFFFFPSFKFDIIADF